MRYMQEVTRVGDIEKWVEFSDSGCVSRRLLYIYLFFDHKLFWHQMVSFGFSDWSNPSVEGDELSLYLLFSDMDKKDAERIRIRLMKVWVLGRSRAKLCCRLISDSILGLFYFTPRLVVVTPWTRRPKKNYTKEVSNK